MNDAGQEVWIRSFVTLRAALEHATAAGDDVVRVQRWVPEQAGTEGWWSTVLWSRRT